jgi:hypothetical protein
MPEHTQKSAEARLTELLKLEDGWLDGDGLKPLQPAVDAARVFLRVTRSWAAWSIGGSEEGGIRLEALGDMAFTCIEFPNSGEMGEVFVLDVADKMKRKT